MPTARELLDQADALMRRNRAPADDIPTLTDEVPPGLGRGAQGAPSKRPGPAADRDSEAIPVLTDAVEEIEAPALDDRPARGDDGGGAVPHRAHGWRRAHRRARRDTGARAVIAGSFSPKHGDGGRCGDVRCCDAGRDRILLNRLSSG